MTLDLISKAEGYKAKCHQQTNESFLHGDFAPYERTQTWVH